MREAAGVLATTTIVTLMFSLGLGLKRYPFLLLRDRPAFLGRVLLGTCVLVPLAGLALVLMPLHGLLSRPTWVAMALLLLSGRQLLPFLQHNLVGLAGMAVLSVFSLAIGYGLAGSDPLERRTVALVTGMRNTGLAAQLALTYGKGLPGLVPGLLVYVLITVIATILFLKWQQRELGSFGARA
jgi:predicted Na+-dependent transporter